MDQLDLTEPTKAKSRLSRLRRAPAKKQPQVTSPQGKGVQVTEQSTEEATQLQHKPHPAPFPLPAGTLATQHALRSLACTLLHAAAIICSLLTVSGS